MKFIIVALAFIVGIYASTSQSEYSYLTPASSSIEAEASAPQKNYIPSSSSSKTAGAAHSKNTFATAPKHSASASAPAAAAVKCPQDTYIAPAATANAPVTSHNTPDAGYRYKTNRRVVYRYRL